MTFAAAWSACQENLAVTAAQQCPMAASNHLPYAMNLPHQHRTSIAPAASQAKLPLLSSTKG
eukprot:CAMPEP_0114674472 /NCGR_PEP_ID=MMETSP0191-20121206/46361_1 /TAXON_ID=126664 /ORGANISM="Sorites sp." /LENGTH=61 /DNA_ID=CAMNT_0001941687 /DNA_START=80 /DNA_END=265 /DNA_ORIENTATION=-